MSDPGTAVSRLQDLMRRKCWVDATSLCEAEPEAIAGSPFAWAAEHVAKCATLAPECQLDQLAQPAAVETRLAQMMPDVELTSVRVVPEGLMSVSAMVLGVRDRATGKAFHLFEKINAQHCSRAVRRELRLFEHVAAERLLAPAILAHLDLDQVIVVLQEYAGNQTLPVEDPWVKAEIRKRHWRARLGGRLRWNIPEDGGKFLSLTPLRALARFAAEGSAERVENLIARAPQIMAALNTMPQFPLHLDLRAANIIMQSSQIAPDLSDIRVVDWGRWTAFPIGAGLPLRASDLALPAQRATLARLHPLSTLAAALFVLNHRPPVMPRQAAALVGLILDAANDVPA